MSSSHGVPVPRRLDVGPHELRDPIVRRPRVGQRVVALVAAMGRRERLGERDEVEAAEPGGQVLGAQVPPLDVLDPGARGLGR
jgi:hypothetical protein